jgi:hypothetical protein
MCLDATDNTVDLWSMCKPIQREQKSHMSFLKFWAITGCSIGGVSCKGWCVAPNASGYAGASRGHPEDDYHGTKM